MITKKCPTCKGCMTYKSQGGVPFLWCDLCQKTYVRIPGGELTLVDNTQELLYNRRKKPWKSIDRSKDSGKNDT